LVGLKNIKNVAVIGGGIMGSGIAQVALLSGYEKVTVIDLNTEILEKSKELIKFRIESLESEEKFKKFISRYENSSDNRQNIDFKQKLSEFKSVGIFADNVETKTILSRLNTETDISRGVIDADFIIEAVTEVLEVKQKVFKQLGKFSPPHALLASNTSTISITKIAQFSERQEKVIGMHFHTFFPIFGMLIEITPGKKTVDESLKLGYEIAQNFPCLIGDRFTVQLEKESPGFIANRIAMAGSLYYSWFLDEAFKNGISRKQLEAAGISFEGADQIGVDTVYNAAKYFEENVSPDFAPSKRIEDLVKAGRLGTKVGKGYYEWNENGPIKELEPLKESTTKFLMENFNPNTFLAISLNEGCRLLEEGVVNSYKLLDKVILKGTFMPGPFVQGKDKYKELVTTLEELVNKTRKTYLKPCEMMESGKFLELR